VEGRASLEAGRYTYTLCLGPGPPLAVMGESSRIALYQRAAIMHYIECPLVGDPRRPFLLSA